MRQEIRDYLTKNLVIVGPFGHGASDRHIFEGADAWTLIARGREPDALGECSRGAIMVAPCDGRAIPEGFREYPHLPAAQEEAVFLSVWKAAMKAAGGAS